MNFIPSVPTDNLYKFMALAGLVIVVLSIVLPASKISEIERLSVEIDSDILLLEAETQWYREDSEKLANEWKKKQDIVERGLNRVESLERGEQKSELDTLRAKNEKFMMEINDSYQTLMERGRQAQRKHLAIKGKIMAKNQLLGEAVFYDRFMLFGSFFGLIIASSGFVFWYARVQKIIDEELKQKIKPVQKEPRRLLKPRP